MARYFNLLRYKQWIKNLLLLFPPFFGGSVTSVEVQENVIPVLLSFCAAASGHYIINDIKDLKADRAHSKKRNRPLAKGEISSRTAIIISVLLFLAATLLSLSVSISFYLYILAYLAITFSYTFFLKSVVIVDIFMISLGFLVRVLAGGEAFGVDVSSWLFMTVFLVSLFLATGKRMGELVSLGENAFNHRKSLGLYELSFLEGALWFTASSALVTYSLYTVEQQTSLFYTVPLAAFGFLRYVYLVRGGDGEPTEVLLKDIQIMIVGIVWAVAIGAIVYGPHSLP